MSDPDLFAPFTVWLVDYSVIGSPRYVPTKIAFVGPMGDDPTSEAFRHGMAIARFCAVRPKDPVQYGKTLASLPEAYVEHGHTVLGPIRRMYIQAYLQDEPPV